MVKQVGAYLLKPIKKNDFFKNNKCMCIKTF